MPLPVIQELPLRGAGPLVERTQNLSSDSAKAAVDPPRALRALSRIIEGGLCHRCGSCVGICPTNVLSVDSDEYPTVKNLSACTDCDLCVKVCPGDEFDAPGVAKQLFSAVPDIRDIHGHFSSSWLAYAVDPTIRAASTSGGLITAMLIDLLERGAIDGAAVVASDSKELWKGAPKIARTREEIFEATKSKYAISPTNVTLAEIRRVDGRYAVVGLPCQIHGVIKAARLDRKIRERVILTIGLFCHAATEHDPMRHVWGQLDGEDRKRAVRFISRLGKHPGTPHLMLEDGSSKPVYFPWSKGFRPGSTDMLNIFYRLYTPSRCFTCYDGTAEFADIAVGDPWMASPDKKIDFREGWSFAFARTHRGEEIMRGVEAGGTIRIVRLNEALARTCNTQMAKEKRRRAFRIIETLKRQGRPIPDYGFEIPALSGKHLLFTELGLLSHFFCFYRKGREQIMRLSLSRFGFALLWLNHQRRRFRFWRRDLRAQLARAIAGRSGIEEN